MVAAYPRHRCNVLGDASPALTVEARLYRPAGHKSRTMPAILCRHGHTDRTERAVG